MFYIKFTMIIFVKKLRVFPVFFKKHQIPRFSRLFCLSFQIPVFSELWGKMVYYTEWKYNPVYNS